MVALHPKHIALAGAPQRLLDVANAVNRIRRDVTPVYSSSWN